jgi:hypothetical protein
VTARTFENTAGSLTALHGEARQAGSILQALTRQTARALPGLSREQVEEERKKAALILRPEDGVAWESALQQAENHPILHGQIQLLLAGAPDLALFTTRWLVFSGLLDQNGSRIGQSGEHLLTRAVLALSDPIALVQQEHRISLPLNRGEWSTIVGRSRGNREFQVGLVRLIEVLSGQASVENTLRDTISASSAGSADRLKPWMLDIILYGDQLLPHSSSRKVQSYYGQGVLLFYGAYANEKDILLGSFAHFRNGLIERLLGLPEWRLASSATPVLCPGEDWRAPRTFYPGHEIRLQAHTGSDGVYCLFGYNRVVVGASVQEEHPIEIDASALTQRNPFQPFLKVAIDSPRLYAVVELLDRLCRDIQPSTPESASRSSDR